MFGVVSLLGLRNFPDRRLYKRGPSISLRTDHFFPVEPRREKKASWGRSTFPMRLSLAFPSFCLLRCFNLRSK